MNRSCPIGWMQIYMCLFTKRIEVKLKVEQFKVACMFVQFISRAAETFKQSKISGERKAVNENEKKSTSSEIDRLLPYMYFKMIYLHTLSHFSIHVCRKLQNE